MGLFFLSKVGLTIVRKYICGVFKLFHCLKTGNKDFPERNTKPINKGVQFNENGDKHKEISCRGKQANPCRGNLGT